MEKQNKQTKSSEEEIKKIKEEFEKCRNERDEYLDGWKRAKADYQNYKKDESERFSSWAKLSSESLIKDILLVLDSLSVGISILGDKNTEKKGMSLIKTQMEDVLGRYGLKKIPVKIGDEFNPAFHEAIGEIESDFPEGKIAEVMDVGYGLSEKVIRPVKIKVSKGQKQSEQK